MSKLWVKALVFNLLWLGVNCGIVDFSERRDHKAPTPAATPLPPPNPNAPEPTLPPQPAASPSPDRSTGTLPEDQATLSPSRKIEFAATGVYHIGDSRYDDSSCRADIQPYGLAGRRYRFEFQVLEANSRVAISVNRLCGVDFSHSNVFYLVKNGTSRLLAYSVPAATGFVVPVITLDQGRYEVIIESTANLENHGDLDNFLVGAIRIESDRLLSRGGIRHE